MKINPCFKLLLGAMLVLQINLHAQDSLKYDNTTAYQIELLTHTSDNDGENSHLLGWLTNTSTLSLNRHSFHTSLMLSHGGEPSANIVGDLQTFSNIEAGFFYGFYELFYQYQDKGFSLKIGQQDINSDLLLTQTGLFFTHSSFGADPVTTINIPAPTYPVASLAITTSIRVNDLLTIWSGIFDGQFAIPQNNFLRLDWSLNRDEGFIYLIEPEFSLLKGKWIQKVGFYYHSGLFERKDNSLLQRGLSTFYLLADIQLKKWGNRQLDFFYQYASSTSIVSDLGYYFGFGFKLTNPWADRTQDEFGVAIGYADLNTQFQSVRENYNFTAETAIEISYKTKVNDWLSLQPYMHYIRMNDLDVNRKSPFIFALRAHIEFDTF